jgi:hypothetical protein
LYLAFLAKYPPKVLTKISATGMVEAALAPLHIKGGSPCEYPHITPLSIVHCALPLPHHQLHECLSQVEEASVFTHIGYS